LWHTDLLLGNDRGISNEITTVATQRPARNDEGTVGSGVLYVVRSESISLDRPSSEELVELNEVERGDW
jgi:hypothetical protein